MRGKRHLESADEAYRGITPAHAGKTERHARDADVPRDHPRACGENTSERAYFRG